MLQTLKSAQPVWFIYANISEDGGLQNVKIFWFQAFQEWLIPTKMNEKQEKYLLEYLQKQRKQGTEKRRREGG